MFKLFPEIDVFIAKIDDQKIKQDMSEKVEYYRSHKGGSGDILTCVDNLTHAMISGMEWEYGATEKYTKTPEFRNLLNKYRRLAAAHSVGYAEIWKELSAATRAYDTHQEDIRRANREKEKSEGRLPRLGVEGEFKTSAGTVRGVVEPGAPVGGPYTIKTPQGKIRVDKIL